MIEKRSRVVTSKPTRNGCRTCRLRHIKCDETKPLCNKCSSSGRPCSGYAPTGSPRKKSDLRQLQPAVMQSLILRSTPSLTPDATEYERYAFDHFRRITARQVHLKTPRAWMTQLVLQLSLEIPVFRAIAALGSIHRGLLQITHVNSVYTLAQDQHIINQYGRAIVSLHRRIGESDPHSPLYLEPLLCACVLLACCEILKDDTTAAISHLRFGNRISMEIHTNNPTEQSLKLHDTKTASTLVSIFELLEANQSNFETESARNYLSSPNLPKCLPTSTDLESARLQLDWLISAGREVRTNFLQLAQLDTSQSLLGKDIVEQCCINHCRSRTIESSITDDLSSRLQRLIAQHVSWLDSLKITLAALNLHPKDHKTRQGLIVLQIQHFYSTFLLTTCRSAREVPSDIFRDEYLRILDLAEQYISWPSLADQNAHELPKMQTNFTVQPVILPALYLIALKCRDSLVRRRAIKLLATADRLEGFQKSRNLATFALQIIEAEERIARALRGLPSTCEEPLSAEQVPEVARFLDVAVILTPGRSMDVRIVCGRFAFESEGEVEVIEITN